MLLYKRSISQSLSGKVLYAAPAWWGLRHRQTGSEWKQSFAAARVLACTANGKLPAKSLTVLMTNNLIKSFGGITTSIHQLLTDRVDISYNLRSRAHSRALPEKKGHLADKNIVVRMLYKYSY